MKIEEQLLISAVRYALGRMSYIVGTTCEFITNNADRLSDNCIHVIIQDIEGELERYHSMGETCGMECDEKEWNRLLNTLKERKHNNA
ncbi:MAG: hypothetical protein IJO13_04745 [Lachnospiraceae bacterium]|nr:hypothetical protein [Lachnospiraceae bacterium]